MASFSVAAYAVIENQETGVLLGRRRDSSEWVLPGGSLEQGEPPWVAVVREVREETGLEVDLERLVGVYVKTRETDLVLVFAATIAGGELRASDEREEARFFSTDSFPAELSEQDRERVEDTLARRERAVLRVQRSQGDDPPPGSR